MGHIVSPVSSRLGNISFWSDSWVTKNMYYSEIFFNSVNIKNYLDYTLANPEFEKGGRFFGYSELKYFQTHLRVNIYIYNAILEDQVEKVLGMYIRRLNSKWSRVIITRIFNVLSNTLKKRMKLKRNIKSYSYYSEIVATSYLLFFFFLAFKFNLRETIKFQQNDKYIHTYQKKMLKLYIKSFKSILKDFALSYMPSYLYTTPRASLKAFVSYLQMIKLVANTNYFFKIFYSRLSESPYEYSTLLSLRLIIKIFIRHYFITFLEFKPIKPFLDSLNSDVSRFTSIPVKFNLLCLDSDTISAYFLSKYIARRLIQNYSINDILKPIKNELKFFRSFGNKLISGYKFHFKGRFTRKQRSSSIWFNQGKVPLNTLSRNIDYGFSAVSLKNGICSVRIWINFTEGLTSKFACFRIF